MKTAASAASSRVSALRSAVPARKDERRSREVDSPTPPQPHAFDVFSRKANHPPSESDNSVVSGRSRNEPPLTFPLIAHHGRHLHSLSSGDESICRKLARIDEPLLRTLGLAQTRAAGARKAGAPSSNTRWIAQHFGALHSAKAATEDDDAFGARQWRGKQLTSTGKLVTTDKLQ